MARTHSGALALVALATVQLVAPAAAHAEHAEVECECCAEHVHGMPVIEAADLGLPASDCECPAPCSGECVELRTEHARTGRSLEVEGKPVVMGRLCDDCPEEA